MIVAKILEALACVLSAYALVRAVRVSSVEKVRFLYLVPLTTLFFTIGYSLEVGTQTMEAALVARWLEYLGLSFYSVAYYIFLRDYINRTLTRVQVLLLLVIPMAALVSVSLYPHVTLFYRGVTLMEQPVRSLVAEPGVLAYLFWGFCAVLSVAAFVQVWRYIPQKRDKGRANRGMFLGGVMSPLVTASAVFCPFAYLRPITFIMQMLVMLLLTYSVLRRCAGEWMPYVRHGVVEQMRDAYILVDNQGRFLDANLMACGYFPVLDDLPRETPLASVEGFPAELLNTGEEGQEIQMSGYSGTICLRSSANHIYRRDERICTCLLLYDVTVEKRYLAELTRKADRDALTGLLNRGAFFRTAERDFALLNRNGQTASLLMMDIDHFKRVNDQYGHPVGDVVIKEVAARILGRLRHTDIGGRYGGEEFCAFLPATDMTGALRIAEEIRSVMEATPVKTGQLVIPFTISVGAVERDPKRHDSLMDLFVDGDAALYLAKAEGRNRVATPKLTPCKIG